MRVHVKKEDKYSVFPLVFMAVFFTIIFSIAFTIIYLSGKPFNEKMASLGILLLFSGLLIFMDILLICSFIKKPKGYIAKLISKKTENYNGQQITYMEFNVTTDPKQQVRMQTKYKCYTIGDNNLNVDDYYILVIKEINWNPKYVEEINNYHKNLQPEPVEKFFSKNSVTMLISGGSVPIIFLILCILGIFMYPRYTYAYIVIGIICSIIILMLIGLVKYLNVTDNPIDYANDKELKLEKIQPVANVHTQVGNIAIKQLLILSLILPIIWFFLMHQMGISNESFLTPYSVVLCIEIPIIIMLLSNIRYDEEVIKKNKINIPENINISNIHNFKIIRTKKSELSAQYFVIDQNNNLILRIKKSNFLGNEYAIANQNNMKIGEIKKSGLLFLDEYTVNIINEKPFIVHPKESASLQYQIIGRDYRIKDDANLTGNIICDTNEKEIANISSISKTPNNEYGMGDTQVILNNGVSNSLDIIIIAVCNTIAKY